MRELDDRELTEELKVSVILETEEGERAVHNKIADALDEAGIAWVRIESGP